MVLGWCLTWTACKDTTDTFFCTTNLHNYSIFSTNPIPLPATTSLQLEPANSVFEPEEVNMNG